MVSDGGLLLSGPVVSDDGLLLEWPSAVGASELF